MAATSVIDLPRDETRPTVPNASLHAKQFVIGVGLVILMGTLLLMLPFATESGRSTNVIDALFTSISATSVTGLVTVDTQSHWSLFGEIVILIMIQLGGFGFMVGTSLVIIALGRGTSLRAALMMQDGSPTMSLQDVTTLSYKILRFIIVTEAVGAVLLTLHFLQYESFPNAVWFGIFHAISAFCNAGFDLQGDYQSLAAHSNSPVALVAIGGLIQMGALSYMVIADVWKQRRWKDLQMDSRLVLITNFGLILASMLLFLVVEWDSAMANIDPRWKTMDALFQAVAARTAGFSSVDWSQAHSATLYLWTAVMMIGGAAGSTAGGIKLATLAVIILAVVSTLRGQTEPQAFGRRIGVTIVFRALAISVMFLIIHFVLALMLVLSEDVFSNNAFSFVSLMFEAMSALATVGLSTGITPDLSIAGKLILCLGMFLGRLGPITAAYALQRRQHPQRYRFPEAHIRLG
jgi:trk system potassium uptake protein TrkH